MSYLINNRTGIRTGITFRNIFKNIKLRNERVTKV